MAGHYSISRILVPIDISDTSLNALQTAIGIAKKHNAVLQILHVVEPQLFSDEDGARVSVNKANRDVLSVLASTLEKHGLVRPRLVIKEGSVITVIQQTAYAWNADLIVMGSHGASGFREGFIGSNAYNIVKYTPCPVLLMPASPRISSFSRVLFPVRPVAGAFVRYDIVCHFLSENAIVEVLGLSNLRIERNTAMLDKLVEELRDQLDAGNVRVNTSWGQGISIADDTLMYASRINTDLLVLTPSLDMVSKVNYVGPNSQRILNQSRGPVLCVQSVNVHVFA